MRDTLHYINSTGWQRNQPTDLPVLEEAWIEVEPGLEPLDVEVEREGDAEVAVVDLEHVRDVQLNLDQVGLAAEWNVHAGVVSGGEEGTQTSSAS